MLHLIHFEARMADLRLYMVIFRPCLDCVWITLQIHAQPWSFLRVIFTADQTVTIMQNNNDITTIDCNVQNYCDSLEMVLVLVCGQVVDARLHLL